MIGTGWTQINEKLFLEEHTSTKDTESQENNPQEIEKIRAERVERNARDLFFDPEINQPQSNEFIQSTEIDDLQSNEIIQNQFVEIKDRYEKIQNLFGSWEKTGAYEQSEVNNVLEGFEQELNALANEIWNNLPVGFIYDSISTFREYLSEKMEIWSGHPVYNCVVEKLLTQFCRTNNNFSNALESAYSQLDEKFHLLSEFYINNNTLVRKIFFFKNIFSMIKTLLLELNDSGSIEDFTLRIYGREAEATEKYLDRPFSCSYLVASRIAFLNMRVQGNYCIIRLQDPTIDTMYQETQQNTLKIMQKPHLGQNWKQEAIKEWNEQHDNWGLIETTQHHEKIELDFKWRKIKNLFSFSRSGELNEQCSKAMTAFSTGMTRLEKQ